MKPMRFGVVGCGVIGMYHGEVITQLAKEGIASLVACADTDAARKDGFVEKWGGTGYDSLAEMLKRDDIDVVNVCTPSGIHGDNCVEIANSGKHFICEKPGDVLVSKVDEAIEAAKKNNVVFGGVFQQRFVDDVQKVKQAIDQGYFGEITFVHSETPWFRSQEYYDSGDWRGTWALDCGVLTNQSPHMIDRLLYLGGDIEEILSATCDTRLRDIEAETVAVATVRLKNGALGTITGTTLAWPGLPQRVLICGTDGSAAFSGDTLVDFKTREPFEYKRDPSIVPETVAPPVDAATPSGGSAVAMLNSGHVNNLRNFVTSMQAGKRPMVLGEDQRKVCVVLNSIYEKAGVGPYAKK